MVAAGGEVQVAAGATAGGGMCLRRGGGHLEHAGACTARGRGGWGAGTEGLERDSYIFCKYA